MCHFEFLSCAIAGGPLLAPTSIRVVGTVVAAGAAHGSFPPLPPLASSSLHAHFLSVVAQRTPVS